MADSSHRQLSNVLAPMQIRLSPNFVSHSLGRRDEVIKFRKVKGQGQWGRYALYWTTF